MKTKDAGGCVFFQKTRQKATTLESANTIGNTTTPALALLVETRSLTENKLREVVLNGSIPSAAYDTACTSNAGMAGDPFIQTGRLSNKVITVADGHKPPGSVEDKLHHPLMDPKWKVDMVPALVYQYLLSANKFAQAGYVTICDNQEVNIYEGRITKIIVSEKAVQKRWFFPKARMWRIPLQPHMSNNNTDTLLLNVPTGTESFKTTYTVPKSARIIQHMQTNRNNRPAADEAINNVYELPSTDPTTFYLNDAAGFPNKATWIKAIHKGNYQSWTLVN